jgi:hypothetical protein
MSNYDNGGRRQCATLAHPGKMKIEMNVLFFHLYEKNFFYDPPSFSSPICNSWRCQMSKFLT